MEVTFCERLRVACTEVMAMDGAREFLWIVGLEHTEVEELLFLLDFFS